MIKITEIIGDVKFGATSKEARDLALTLLPDPNIHKGEFFRVRLKEQDEHISYTGSKNLIFFEYTFCSKAGFSNGQITNQWK